MNILDIQTAVHVNKSGEEINMIMVSTEEHPEYLRLLENRDSDLNPIGFEAMCAIVTELTLAELNVRVTPKTHGEHGNFYVLSSTKFTGSLLK